MADTTTLVPVFSGVISNTAVQLCDARALHTFMQVRRDFSNWIKGRIAKFGFVAGEDFITVENLSSPDLASAKARQQKLIDYHLTLDMAKELAMVENNAQGRAARKYFIACERELMAARQPALPYSVQPGDVLTLSQGDELRAMLEAAARKLPIEKRGAFLQSGWAKLRAHTGVNYRKIPQAAHTDALSLLARHVAEWELVDEAPAPTLRGRRWLIATDHAGHETVQPIGQNDFVTTWPALVAGVESGDCLRSNAELLAMASACTRRVHQRTLRN